MLGSLQPSGAMLLAKAIPCRRGTRCRRRFCRNSEGTLPLGALRCHHHYCSTNDCCYIRPFSAEDELLHLDGFHRWFAHRPSDTGFRQQYRSRRLQTSKHRIRHSLSADNVFENFYSAAAGFVGDVKNTLSFRAKRNEVK